MAIHSQGMSRVAAIPVTQRTVAAGIVSATADMNGFQRALVVVQKEARSGQSGKVVCRLAHVTADTVTYASAVTLGTTITGGILSTATAATAEYDAFNVDWTGKGRFLRVIASGATASSNYGVTVYRVEADKVPPSSTGFTTYKNLPNNP